MQEFFSNIVSGIGINDVLDVLITTFIIYKILGFVRKTRAQSIVMGLLILLVAYFVANLLKLNIITWLFKSVFTVAIFALVVIFQPELRRALEYVGRKSFGISRLKNLDTETAKKIVDEIVQATDDFSQTRTGAIMVFERKVPLGDYLETGTVIDAEISAQMLGNIFYEGAPLHDGAVIIRGDRIHAAGVVLPLTSNKNLNKSLGTRHRAGIGITEASDALVIIVSEETGIIPVAEDGQLRRFLDGKNIEKILLDMYVTGEDEKAFSVKKVLDFFGIRRGKNAK